MNQEQNNLNPNNFNTQGNNGIPNNQPLENNQGFNPTFNQNVAPNTNVNQPTFNPQPVMTSAPVVEPMQQPVQPQPIPSHERPRMQEPTPQPVNPVESGNTNNQNSNNKLPKKMNLGLIIGIVVIILLIFIITILLTSKGKLKSNNNNILKMSGELKLVHSAKSIDIPESNQNLTDYFEVIEENGDKYLLGLNGEKISVWDKVNGKTTFGNYKYLGNGYFAVEKDNNKIIIQKNGKEIVTLDSGSNIPFMAAKDGIVYYSFPRLYDWKTIAYDLESRKKIWETNGRIGYIDRAIYTNGLENNFIRLEGNNSPVLHDNSLSSYLFYSNAVDYNGNTIVSDNKDCSTYVSSQSTYIKSVEKEYIEIYNFEGKSIFSKSLKPTETSRFYLSHVFNNGYFIIMEFKDVSNTISSLYDFNGNLIYNFNGTMLDKFSYSSDLVMVKANDFLLLKGDKIIGKYREYLKKENYVLLKLPYEENKLSNAQLLNLNTLKIIDLNFYDGNISDISPTGNNLIVQNVDPSYRLTEDSAKYYLYDKDFNLIYKTNNKINLINDEYILEFVSEEVYLKNIKKNTSVLLEFTGKYCGNTSEIILTCDGTKEYLYAFK